jgi:hypothetical protein
MIFDIKALNKGTNTLLVVLEFILWPSSILVSVIWFGLNIYKLLGWKSYTEYRYRIRRHYQHIVPNLKQKL